MAFERYFSLMLKQAMLDIFISPGHEYCMIAILCSNYDKNIHIIVNMLGVNHVPGIMNATDVCYYCHLIIFLLLVLMPAPYDCAPQ